MLDVLQCTLLSIKKMLCGLKTDYLTSVDRHSSF